MENKVLLADPKLREFASKSDKDVDTNGLIQAMNSDFHDPQLWFIQSNNRTASAGGRLLADGLALEVSGSQDTNDPLSSVEHDDVFQSAPIRQLRSLHPAFVLIDSETPISETPFDPNESLILKVNTSAADDGLTEQLNVLSRLWKATPQSATILNLLPESKKEALTWGLSDLDAVAYADAGREFSSNLDNYGFRHKVSVPRNTNEFQSKIEEAARLGDIVVVIGESGDEGGTLRIPGSDQTIDAKKAFSSLPSKAMVVGLFCNSHQSLINTNAVSFVGTIYSDKTQKLLRIVLDKREPGTVAEYIGASTNVDSSLYVSHDHVSRASLPSLLAGLSGSLQSGQQALGFPLIRFPLPVTESAYVSGKPKQTPPPVQPQGEVQQQPGVIEIPAKTPNYWLCLAVGLLGGLCREFLRWKRLAESKRHDLYLKPLFYAISLGEMALGALLALVFVNLSPVRATDLPISFVAGAGFEFIVQLAMKGKMWTPRGVPQGAGVLRPASVIEYLRA